MSSSRLDWLLQTLLEDQKHIRIRTRFARDLGDTTLDAELDALINYQPQLRIKIAKEISRHIKIGTMNPTAALWVPHWTSSELYDPTAMAMLVELYKETPSRPWDHVRTVNAALSKPTRTG